MRTFSCSVCQQMVFFENVQCTKCGSRLGYLPEHKQLSALEPAGAPGIFVALAPAAKRACYRQCRNGVEHAACNWLILDGEPGDLCAACRLNTIIPDLDRPGALPAWQELERAKRRLVYTLHDLGLPVESRADDPAGGLAFAFKSDDPDAQERVLTGHSGGLITINIAEADDPIREQVKKDLGEVYRTLLGHFRHEVGHYYWDRLIRDTPWHGRFRALFGDESADYAEAVKRHYEQGARPDWMQDCVSAYAAMHPWENWAETFAHYLHMVDTLGTARAFGMVLSVKPVGGSAQPVVSARSLDLEDFDDLIAGWMPLTIAMNSLNRSMGMHDLYPFVLGEQVIAKLRFVHDVVANWSAAPDVIAAVLSRWSSA
jgi:hypothetical protein